MPKTLTIEVKFEDDSDFDLFRYELVGHVEDAADELTDPETGKADGKIEVSWEVED